ncbi:MAG: peptidoglycan-binding domain-containing protein [Candidatus Heimdallarchaeaceae archaeon]
MFKDFTVFQIHTPNRVASMYFGGFYYKFKGDYPSGTYEEIKHFLLNTSAKDKVYTVPFTLRDAIRQAKQYSMKLVIGMNEVMRENIPLVPPEHFGLVAGILADILIENGFNDTNAALNLINEPCERWKLHEMGYVQYCYRTNDYVKGRLPLIISNEEYHRWNERIIFEQTANIPQRIWGVHHLSSLDKGMKNVVYAKTQANEWKVPIICNEGGSWFKSYHSEEGHNINVELLHKCKRYNYLGFGICLNDVNQAGREIWPCLGYRIWSNDYSKILSQTNWDKFKNEIKKYWKGETVSKDRVIKLSTPAMEGEDVKKIENKLRELGFDIKANSRYESDDYYAVRVFQRETKITIDGIVGPQTKGKLEETTVDNFYPEVFKNIYEKKDYSIEAVDYFLSEYAHPNLLGHGKYFKQAEEETGIPVEWQLANGMQESGVADSTGRVLLGNSYYGREWKNLYGWAITDSGPLSQGRFETYRDCILIVTHKIKDLFLEPNNWRYAGDHIFGIEKYYSTAPYNAINKAKWYRFICEFLDKGIKTKMPEYVEDLVPILSEYFIRRD